MQGFHPQAHGKKKPMQSYANGGPVKGPGTGTSDDVDAEVRPGSYVMPADTMDATKGFNPAMRKVALSNGESVLTPEQMQAIGAGVLEMVKSMTHESVGEEGAEGPESTEHEFMEGEQGEAMEGGEGKQDGMKYGFADGGLVDDEKRRKALVNQIPTALPAGPQQRPGPAIPEESDFSRNVKNTAMALGPVSGAVAPVLGGLARAGAGFTRAATASPLIEKTLAYGAPVAGFGALASASQEPSPSIQQPVASKAVAPAVRPVTSPTAGSTAPGATTVPESSPAGSSASTGNVNVKRQSNGVMEFSGENVAGDVSYGGNSGFKPSGAGVSAQNMAAADQLAARYASPPPSQPAPAMAQPAAQGFAPQDAGGYGLLDRGRIDRRNAMMDVQQQKPGAKAAFNAVIASQAAAPGQALDRDRWASDTQFRADELAQRGQSEQAAQGFRVGQLANDTQRTAIEGQKAGSEIEARGFEIGQARRVEALRAKYAAATDPKVRAELAQQLRTLSGGKEQDNRFTVVPGGQEFDAAAGVMRNVPARVLNNQTGQFVDGSGGQAKPLAQNQAAMAIVNDTSLSKDERKAKLREMGYN